MTHMPNRHHSHYVANGEIDDDITNPIHLKPLPTLPVPPLRQSLERYLKSLSPLVSREQYAKTHTIVQEFLEPGGEGEKLQQMILEMRDTKVNWTYDYWLDDMYLKVRSALPINSNPGMVFPKQHFRDEGQRLRFAAKLISGILDYKVVIDARALPVDRARHNKPGQPLCMEQYYRLFSSYRVPGLFKDELVSPGSSLMPEPEHIIVVCQNQFFILDVIINFKRLSDQDLVSQLKRILDAAKEHPDSVPLGLLTTADRPTWAGSRARLIEDSTNRDSLDMIERCIFVLCLDEAMDYPKPEVGKPIDSDDEPLAHHMLHGGGVHKNTGNRWFDKTMQFIIGTDGQSGLNYEHSPSEGVAVVQLVEHLLKYIDSETHKRKLTRAQSICELPNPRKLNWKISPSLLQDIEIARSQITYSVNNIDVKLLRFTQFGKNFPKSQNMSPDAFVQLALQLTYYRIYGRLTSTYESASTRRFQEGRVDNIRAASPEALEFVRAIKGEREANIEEKKFLMREAIKAQTETCLQTITGQGFDCHLLCLREVSQEMGLPLPAVFADESFEISNRFCLSTSQVLTKLDTFMCYGPVVHHGYGASYNPHEDYILFAIASFKSCTSTDSHVFRAKLYQTLIDMHELCTGTKPKTNNNSNGYMQG